MDEMNHLYNMFLKQVHEHCSTLSMPDCKKVLLVYGLTNLAKMEEDSLDKMDPYQRGAPDVIWESMMKGSYKTSGATGQKEDFSSQKNNLYETSSNNGNYLGSQEEASSEVHHYLPYDSRPHIGPMMVRVLPNGNPIPGETGITKLKDEDAEEFKLMRAQPPIPIEELAKGSSPHPSAGEIHHGIHNEQPTTTAT
ncbi:rhythmically expressed gene 5 protein isoform X2 [Anabrus simplex]|uniref:rhythmically expressed gene 5 protein isoform X2 n=1 Tax=Anabrus simplex TaxID=316456 RepID=UPI0034DD36CF